MTIMRRLLGAAVVFGLGAAMPVQASPQVELDRIVSRVNGRIITASDVRQCRQLKLVDDVSSDAAAQRALENRWLILAEMNRAAAVAPPSDADVAARRAEWVATLGGSPNLAASGMAENELRAWLRDDLRIRAYLNRQFGTMPEADRSRATGDWLGRLRERADLR